MRIAFFVSQFPAVSETFIIDQITGLMDLGHEVDIYSRIRPECPVVHSEVKEYGLLNRTYYLPKKPSGKRACRLLALNYLLVNLVVRPWGTIRALRFLMQQEVGFSYKEYFMMMPMVRRRYEVIHCHFGHNANMVLCLKKAFPELGFVAMFHGTDILMGQEKESDYYHELFNYADILLANSPYTRQRLLEFGASEAKTVVHSAGIDLEYFSVKLRSDHTSTNSVSILTIARLVGEKAIDVGLKAFAKVLKSKPEIDIIWHIVGDGMLKEQLIELSHQLGINNRVAFYGSIERNEIVRFLSDADIFLLPSVSEGLGMVLLEAEAMEIPVISTTAGGIPSAVVNGKSAFLVAPGDVDALAEKLEFLIRNPHLWPEMGKAGRKYVEQNYDARQLNQRLVEIYRATLP